MPAAGVATEPTLLLLVRHARPVRFQEEDPPMNGWTDVPLSDLGRDQARQIALRLRELPVRAPVYTSSLRRATETAAAIARETELPVVRLRCLREIHCGVVDGWPVSRVKRDFPASWRANLAQDDADFRWPGGETYRHFRSGVLRGVWSLVARHAGESVIVVTHAGVATQLLGSFCGITPARWDVYRPGNASLTNIELCGGRGILRKFDDRDHLESVGSES